MENSATSTNSWRTPSKTQDITQHKFIEPANSLRDLTIIFLRSLDKKEIIVHKKRKKFTACQLIPILEELQLNPKQNDAPQKRPGHSLAIYGSGGGSARHLTFD